MKNRNYWVISPNVKNNNEVDDWRTFLSKYPLVCMGWSPDDKGGDSFYKEMKIDDVVIVAQRQSWNWNIYSLGMVSSNVFSNGDGIDSTVWEEMPTESWYRKLSYWISKPKIETFNGYKGQIPPAIWKLTDEETIKNINAMITTEKKNIERNKIIKLLKFNKNLILTGAPGTGKTYLAKQIASQMIGVKTDEELEESGQFNFVQFHPSYDYTDFVEGLRPYSVDDEENIGFRRKDGVFKEFCKKALNAKISNKVDNFDDAWEELISMVKDNLANGNLTKIGSWEYGLSTKNSLKYSSVDTPSQYKFTITKHNVYNAYQNIKARPSGAFQKDMEDVVAYMKQNLHLKDFQEGIISKETENNKYVFIIDEINRAEISKVFGELFFSIDPNYRGEKGKVKTQYDNLQDANDVYADGFFVPENVYIIGTMNDIDRSVESFDFAMRRRFTWIEITAEQSADNMNLPQDIKERMLKLNEQISNTDGLNSSYHIGAAYFLDSNGNYREDIENIWKLRIEPLLKEYLRGIPDSIEKIELLNNAFTS